ncbi:conserved protein, unknown function [Plasmodium falciparum 3D7]|uniref:Uncharacterized protein n=2 Tax=Plasmodium falciparum TaxID=5833 RepID=Q8IJ84_PLAF7|nr:conserved protein, unknown function [Plasmodium falciparum 3D7]PKC43680.1 hypothetical protein CK202_4910 [Plasmodium falciparum NF54]CZT98580.1 conserved protein, unknown function [Plasmodium falciparum 3D7]|eukprot:XP_001347599.1 conserved Plasmodium protein, unknown function [Plasmodium falciparum 3D7]
MTFYKKGYRKLFIHFNNNVIIKHNFSTLDINRGSLKKKQTKEKFEEVWKNIIRKKYIKKIVDIFEIEEEKKKKKKKDYYVNVDLYDKHKKCNNHNKYRKIDENVKGIHLVDGSKKNIQNDEYTCDDNQIVDPPRTCYFVVGSEGVGKKFIIEKAKEIFVNSPHNVQYGDCHNSEMKKNKKKKKNIFFEYDFKEMNDIINFSMKIYTLEYCLRYTLLKELNDDIIHNYINLKDIYDNMIYKDNINKSYNMLSRWRDFFIHIYENPQLYDYFNEKDLKEINNYQIMIKENKYNYETWYAFLEILLKKLKVKAFCNYFNHFSAYLYFFKMLGDYEEYDYYKKNTNNILINYTNGKFIYTYFLYILGNLQHIYNYNFFFLFYNFHLFLLSTQPIKDFNFFVNFLKQNIYSHTYCFPMVIHAIKNLEIMKSIFMYNNIIIKWIRDKHVVNQTKSKHIEKAQHNDLYLKKIQCNPNIKNINNKNKNNSNNNMCFSKDIQYTVPERINNNMNISSFHNLDDNKYAESQQNFEESTFNMNNIIKNKTDKKKENIETYYYYKKYQETLSNKQLKDMHINTYNTSEEYELIINNIIEIDDFSYDMIKSILIPHFTNNQDICNYIYKYIGGNIKLIKTICKSLYELNQQFDECEIIKQIENARKENITYDMDEEEEDILNSPKKTIEQIITYKKNEKEKLFLKDLCEQVLHNFILNFEQKIIQFFSLPNIEKMKINQYDKEANDKYNNNNDDDDDKIKQTNDNKSNHEHHIQNNKPLNFIQFYFTIFETIRYFLKKQKVFCYNIINLNNPILLGLIDVNIIHYNYQDKYLELTNKFYHILLLNYIELKYKQYPFKLRVQYNVNYMLNYKIIEHEYKLLECKN